MAARIGVTYVGHPQGVCRGGRFRLVPRQLDAFVRGGGEPAPRRLSAERRGDRLADERIGVDHEYPEHLRGGRDGGDVIATAPNAARVSHAANC